MAGELPVEFGEKHDAVGEAKLRTGGGRNMDRKHVKDAADKHVLAQSGGRDDFPPLSPAALRRGFFSLASSLAKGGGPEK